MTGVWVVLAVLFGGLGFGLLFSARNAKRKARASLTWPTVPGKVIASDIKVTVSTSKSGESEYQTEHFRPIVKYQYSVQGVEHSCSRIAFGATNTAQSAADAIMARYPAGADVTVHYNPEKPEEAVLETRESGATALTILAVVFLLVGAGSAVLLAIGLVAGPG